MNPRSFSERFGHEPPDAEITIREDAPVGLRDAVLGLCARVGLSTSEVRSVVCAALTTTPDRNNWSEGNIADEVYRLVHDCAWFEVYDIIEALVQHLRYRRSPTAGGQSAALEFGEQLNRFFRRAGIGWQLVNEQLEVRGSEVFEHAVRQGRDELWAAAKTTAATELHEALQDLSRRPTPEVTGAIQHAMAALECLARDKAISQATLGDLVRRHPDLFPRPLETVVEKVWGYTSNQGRHLQEGLPPSFEEAELVVGLCGVLCRYLSRKI